MNWSRRVRRPSALGSCFLELMSSTSNGTESLPEVPLFLRDEGEETHAIEINHNTSTSGLTAVVDRVTRPASPPTNSEADYDIDMLLGNDAGDGKDSPLRLDEGKDSDSVMDNKAANASGSFTELSKELVASSLRSHPPSSDHASSPPRSSPPQASRKRQRRKTAGSARKQWYLGSFLVSNAWSTAKGSGYIKPGEHILIERDTLQKIAEGKTVNEETGKQQRGKQKTLNSMFKTQPKPTKQLPNVSKKPKTNNVVRLTNARGFGVHPFLLMHLLLFVWLILSFRVREIATGCSRLDLKAS